MPPDNPDYSELLVQISYTLDFYQAESLLGCLTDGLKFFYYKFSKIQEGVKIEWKHNIFYDNAVPSSKEVVAHLQFLFDVM